MFHWIAGTTAAARLLRVAMILLLLLWGVMEQVHFYWANVPASLNSLEREAVLNPDDSAVQSRLARARGTRRQPWCSVGFPATSRSGESRQSGSPGKLRAALIVFLPGREAYSYQLYPQCYPDALPKIQMRFVNYRLLAQRLGHPEEAIDALATRRFCLTHASERAALLGARAPRTRRAASRRCP